MATRAPEQGRSVKEEINGRLLESGELDKLESHLLHLLQSSGWTEELRRMCEQRLKSGEAKNYDELFRSVAREAEEMVRTDVKVEVVGEIRRVVGAWVDGG